MTKPKKKTQSLFQSLCIWRVFSLSPPPKATSSSRNLIRPTPPASSNAGPASATKTSEFHLIRDPTNGIPKIRGPTSGILQIRGHPSNGILKTSGPINGFLKIKTSPINGILKSKTSGPINVVENPKEMVKELKIEVPLDDDDYSSGESNGEDPLDGDKICRICHLSSDHGPGIMDLIELGCNCRGELGIVHRHYAETWFKLKGNRCCEICGEIAKNITEVGDMRFMEEWNERRSLGNSSITSARGRCWRGHRLCNFLMFPCI